ncbi:transcription elongation factor A protein 1-like [Panonychus citri]|uniref:transcription elongation factor A protein 1-like n=1 Tax=Panonychus citri TaxID=50023 RepID=UPI002308125B|nr:transcription elongation factor A protein 1-like [Panonychus citri]
MGHEEEVLRIGKKLDKMGAKKEGFGQALDLLKALKEIPITLEILQRTRIGMAVNNLRKNCSNEEVISLAKSLIRSWKKLLEVSKEGKSDSNNTDNGSTSGSSGNKTISSGNSGSTGSGGGDTGSKNGSNKSTTSRSNAPGSDSKPKQSFPSNTSNEIRLKGRQLLAEALKQGMEESSGETFFDPEDLAAQIEDNIYKEFKDINMKYKNRIRSRVSNLKDSKNPDLKFNVLRGHISASRIAVMTAEEMASNEMKELRQKLTKEAINDHQMAVTGGTKTDLIKCPKCKKTNTTYNQVQTRSADEPMTTFCFCNECGYRWKFC